VTQGKTAMLFLVMTAGANRYAIDVAHVVEVVPFVHVTPVARAPAAVAGVITYRGAPVPIVDLPQLLAGRPAALRLSTRIVLANLPDGRGGTRLLGLLAEHLIGTMRRDPSEFADAGIGGDSRAIGPVATDEQGVVHWIDPAVLLPQAVKDVLFTEQAHA
jgi:chemotaxis-related protein WspB